MGILKEIMQAIISTESDFAIFYHKQIMNSLISEMKLLD